MSDRKKEIILKTVIVIGAGALVIVFAMCVLSFFIDDNNQLANHLFFMIVYVSGALAAVFGVLLIILEFVWGGLKQKPVAAERLTSSYQSYEAVVNHIISSLAIQKYEMQPPYSLSDLGELTLFVRKRLLKLDCFVVVRVPELTEERENLVNDSINASLLRYYGYDHTEQITDHVSMTALFCVDRVTAAFQKLVNSNIQQGFKNSRLPTGISFGSNTVYIAKQQDGYAIKEYKRLRKEFLAIMELTPEKKKKPDGKKNT